MQQTFWEDVWNKGQIGFHYDTVNPMLSKHFRRLGLEKEDTVFVPMCGKSGDISWLLKEGFKVIGVDIVEKPLIEFLEAEKIIYSTYSENKFKVFKAENIEFYCGDFFNLPDEIITKTKAIYDRASLVALPFEMRKDYYQIINKFLEAEVKYLLLTFNFDKALNEGPPFMVTEREIENNLIKPIKQLGSHENIRVFASNI
ncbi:MAG TPA: hypothetical protein V6C96_04090 [Vampirovibrionales bacterium]